MKSEQFKEKYSHISDKFNEKPIEERKKTGVELMYFEAMEIFRLKQELEKNHAATMRMLNQRLRTKAEYIEKWSQ